MTQFALSNMCLRIAHCAKMPGDSFWRTICNLGNSVSLTANFYSETTPFGLGGYAIKIEAYRIFHFDSGDTNVFSYG
jgi:hypothetical protein